MIDYQRVEVIAREIGVNCIPRIEYINNGIIGMWEPISWKISIDSIFANSEWGEAVLAHELTHCLQTEQHRETVPHYLTFWDQPWWEYPAEKEAMQAALKYQTKCSTVEELIRETDKFYMENCV